MGVSLLKNRARSRVRLSTIIICAFALGLDFFGPDEPSAFWSITLWNSVIAGIALLVVIYGLSLLRHRAEQVVLYAVTAFTCASYFVALSGAEPATHTPITIPSAILGAALFGVSCAISPFSSRFGIIGALMASILCWPYFLMAMRFFPWATLSTNLPYGFNPYTLAATLMLVATTVYSIGHLASAVKSTNERSQ